MFNKKLKIKFKKLNENAVMPTYGTKYSAGADLYSAEEEVVINPGETAFIGTGIACAIPNYKVGLIYARSGLACKKGLAPANKVGVIDSDYRGEIKVALHNHGKEPQTSTDRTNHRLERGHRGDDFDERSALCPSGRQVRLYH